MLLTFTERLRLRLLDKKVWEKQPNPWYATNSKIKAKEMVSSIGIRVPKTYWTGSDLGTVPNLPDRYVLKATRGDTSHHVLVMDKGCDRMRYGRPLSWNEIVSIAQNWKRGLFLIEELIEDEQGNVPPIDYKIYTFGPYVVMIVVCDMSVPHGRFAWRNPNWEPITPMNPKVARLPEDLASPFCLREMVEAASRIGQLYGTFVRLDFYATSRGPVFGETCPWPGAAQPIIEENDRWLGELWARLLGDDTF